MKYLRLLLFLIPLLTFSCSNKINESFLSGKWECKDGESTIHLALNKNKEYNYKESLTPKGIKDGTHSLISVMFSGLGEKGVWNVEKGNLKFTKSSNQKINSKFNFIISNEFEIMKLKKKLMVLNINVVYSESNEPLTAQFHKIK